VETITSVIELVIRGLYSPFFTRDTSTQNFKSTCQLIESEKAFRAIPPFPNRSVGEEKRLKKIFRYGELNPGLAGLMLYMRAADASHYTITDYV
jgi:hypothetical protein